MADGETVPAELAGMAPLFRRIADIGFHADPVGLRRGFPDIGWLTFAAWAGAQDRTASRRPDGKNLGAPPSTGPVWHSDPAGWPCSLVLTVEAPT